MSTESDRLRQLILGMRKAYARGENAMAYARAMTGGTSNELAATLIAYDLQTGTYTEAARSKPEANQTWCAQLAALIDPLLPTGGSVLEMGCGDATTLSGVLSQLDTLAGGAFGFDISWSRVAEGARWLAYNDNHAELFVADLFGMPLADNSVDIVYSSHSVEPNRGREREAIAECLRVARTAVVLVEPAYELADQAARERMDSHGYVRGLREAAEALGADVLEHRLLEHYANPRNRSGVLTLRKPECTDERISSPWRCPLTGAPLQAHDDLFYAESVGIAYPVMRGIPLLRPEHAVVASGIGKS